MLANTLGKEYSDADARARFLNDNCDKVAETEYLKVFDADALTELKNSLSETAISIDRLEDEKKEAVSSINDALKGKKIALKGTLKKLKDKAESVVERCYVFIDEDTRTAGIYNGAGNLVTTRPLKPDELQRTVFGIVRDSNHESTRTGTNE